MEYYPPIANILGQLSISYSNMGISFDMEYSLQYREVPVIGSTFCPSRILPANKEFPLQHEASRRTTYTSPVIHQDNPNIPNCYHQSKYNSLSSQFLPSVIPPAYRIWYMVLGSIDGYIVLEY